MDTFVQAKIDQCQAPFDHPRDYQRREQVIDSRIQPVLSRAVPRSPRTRRLDDLGNLPHGAVSAVQHAHAQRLVHTLYRRLRASYSYDRRASDSARCSLSDAVSRATRNWARKAMTAPPIPEAAPISATTRAVTNKWHLRENRNRTRMACSSLPSTTEPILSSGSPERRPASRRIAPLGGLRP